MYTKQLLIGVLATLLTFGLFGTVFADGNPNDEAGKWQHSFAAVEKTGSADMSLNYTQEDLVGVDEKGLSDHDFNAPKSSADIAAINYVYDPEKIKPGEFGKLGVGFSNKVSLICNGC